MAEAIKPRRMTEDDYEKLFFGLFKALREAALEKCTRENPIITKAELVDAFVIKFQACKTDEQFDMSELFAED